MSTAIVPHPNEPQRTQECGYSDKVMMDTPLWKFLQKMHHQWRKKMVGACQDINPPLFVALFLPQIYYAGYLSVPIVQYTDIGVSIVTNQNEGHRRSSSGTHLRACYHRDDVLICIVL